MHRHHQAVLTLPPRPRSARDARRFVDRVLGGWGCDRLAESVELLVSELVANAVRHAGTPVRLTLSRDGDGVRVAVRDGSPDRPRPRLPDTDSETGRGLFLVDQLTTDWGVEEDRNGKTVWFALGPVTQRAPAR
jgi:anti-sigma regulatory factor (Ser/Thr protein kinase)